MINSHVKEKSGSLGKEMKCRPLHALGNCSRVYREPAVISQP